MQKSNCSVSSPHLIFPRLDSVSQEMGTTWRELGPGTHRVSVSPPISKPSVNCTAYKLFSPLLTYMSTVPFGLKYSFLLHPPYYTYTSLRTEVKCPLLWKIFPLLLRHSWPPHTISAFPTLQFSYWFLCLLPSQTSCL